jgi:hypothetical protein
VGASKRGVVLAATMAIELVTGGGVISPVGTLGPGIVPATAMVTSPAGAGDGSARTTLDDSAAEVSPIVKCVSTTFCRWGLGGADEGLQDRFIISNHQNNSTTFIAKQMLTLRDPCCRPCASAFLGVAAG